MLDVTINKSARKVDYTKKYHNAGKDEINKTANKVVDHTEHPLNAGNEESSYQDRFALFRSNALDGCRNKDKNAIVSTQYARKSNESVDMLHPK